MEEKNKKSKKKSKQKESSSEGEVDVNADYGEMLNFGGEGAEDFLGEEFNQKERELNFIRNFLLLTRQISTTNREQLENASQLYREFRMTSTLRNC